MMLRFNVRSVLPTMSRLPAGAVLMYSIQRLMEHMVLPERTAPSQMFTRRTAAFIETRCLRARLLNVIRHVLIVQFFAEHLVRVNLEVHLSVSCEPPVNVAVIVIALLCIEA